METPPVSMLEHRYTDRVILIGIVTIGAWLRFTGLDVGIPFSPGVDEPEIVNRAIKMMQTGQLNPSPFFDYPTLYIYVQFVTAVVRYLVGAMNGMWSSLDQALSPDFYWTFFPWGRAVSAGLGTATILVTYFSARRIGRIAALAAAALVATQSMLVRESHFILTDTPMTFFVALTLLLSVRASERGTPRAYLAAGAAAGLAAASKYNGGVAIIMPLLALVVGGSQPALMTCALSTIAGAAVAFTVSAPYTFIELPAFLDAFGRLTSLYAQPGRSSEASWVTYLKHLRINLFTEGLVLAAASFPIAALRVFRGPKAERVVWGAAGLFAAVWFLMVAGQSMPKGRYLLPMLPPLFVLMGGAIGNIPRFVVSIRTSTTRFALLAALVLAVIARPTFQSVTFATDAAKVQTPLVAYQWILQNIPAGSHVAVETRMLILPQDRYTSTNEPQLVRRSFEDYVENKVQYLVASSQSFDPYVYGNEKASPTGAAYRDLFRRLELVYSLMASAEHPGPEIRIYRLVP